MVHLTIRTTPVVGGLAFTAYLVEYLIRQVDVLAKIQADLNGLCLVDKDSDGHALYCFDLVEYPGPPEAVMKLMWGVIWTLLGLGSGGAVAQVFDYFFPQLGGAIVDFGKWIGSKCQRRVSLDGLDDDSSDDGSSGDAHPGGNSEKDSTDTGSAGCNQRTQNPPDLERGPDRPSHDRKLIYGASESTDVLKEILRRRNYPCGCRCEQSGSFLGWSGNAATTAVGSSQASESSESLHPPSTNSSHCSETEPTLPAATPGNPYSFSEGSSTGGGSDHDGSGRTRDLAPAQASNAQKPLRIRMTTTTSEGESSMAGRARANAGPSAAALSTPNSCSTDSGSGSGSRYMDQHINTPNSEAGAETLKLGLAAAIESKPEPAHIPSPTTVRQLLLPNGSTPSGSQELTIRTHQIQLHPSPKDAYTPKPSSIQLQSLDAVLAATEKPAFQRSPKGKAKGPISRPRMERRDAMMKDLVVSGVNNDFELPSQKHATALGTSALRSSSGTGPSPSGSLAHISTTPGTVAPSSSSRASNSNPQLVIQMSSPDSDNGKAPVLPVNSSLNLGYFSEGRPDDVLFNYFEPEVQSPLRERLESPCSILPSRARTSMETVRITVTSVTEDDED